MSDETPRVIRPQTKIGPKYFEDEPPRQAAAESPKPAEPVNDGESVEAKPEALSEPPREDPLIVDGDAIAEQVAHQAVTGRKFPPFHKFTEWRLTALAKFDALPSTPSLDPILVTLAREYYAKGYMSRAAQDWSESDD